MLDVQITSFILNCTYRCVFAHLSISTSELCNAHMHGTAFEHWNAQLAQFLPSCNSCQLYLWTWPAKSSDPSCITNTFPRPLHCPHCCTATETCVVTVDDSDNDISINSPHIYINLYHFKDNLMYYLKE